MIHRSEAFEHSAGPAPPVTNNRESPLSKSSTQPMPITAQELRLFKSPDFLHGKQFILSPDTDDSGTYEVVGYSKNRDQTVQFDVLFDDCEDPIKVDAEEMMGMLRDSHYLPA